MKKVINKGYTLEVTSWENDGDNYKTKSKPFESRELALAVKCLCETVFKSYNNGDGGIGNSIGSDEEEKANIIIVNYFRTHSELYPHMLNPTDDELIDFCMDLNYELMGGSEYYYSRVFESCSLTYSKEDIYLEEIN